MAAVRVFIGGVDSYTGKILAEVISGLAEEYYPENQKDQASNFKIVGTLLDESSKKPKGVHEIVDSKNKDALKNELLQCTHIVYDITQHPSQMDEVAWAVQALDASSDSFPSTKVFVCISTIMTWAKTKPNEGEDPDTPIAEDDYRRRRPHMNFKAHVEAEKAVTKVGKKDGSKLQTYVVAAGLLYGEGEQLFHRFFRTAWELTPPYLECYGNGDNILPSIHVRDLAGLVSNVFTTTPQTRYILAIDDAQSTLDDILRSISETLGTRTVRKIPKEDALAKSDLPQADYDSLLLSLRIEPAAIKELPWTWHCQSGLVENMAAVVAEFKKARHLEALKIFVFGPPGSGKTQLSKQLSTHYQLPHIHVAGLIKSTQDNLHAAIAALEKPEVSPEETERAEAAKEELAEAKANLESNGGRYGDDLLTKWCREELGKGYVLDGFPKTLANAKDIFGGAEERDTAIMPEFVFALDATDDFLKERIMSLPESEVANTHNNEEGFLRRLVRYRAENTDDTTVLNYFDLIEIHPTNIVADNSSAPLERALQTVGQPRNYGPSAEEKAVLAAAESERKAHAAIKAMEDKLRIDAAMASETAKAQAAWAAMRDEIQKQHADERDQAALPLRAFLVKNVLPTLTKGLMEVCDVRPEDPIDYLAEYLFKNNPRIE